MGNEVSLDTLMLPGRKCKKKKKVWAQNSAKNNFLPLCLETSLVWKFIFLCSFLKNYPLTFEKNSFFNKLWA